ncbi:C4-dicarboxylate ABC transporter substrate-binding protein [Alcanivorax sp. N3-2A]|nr:C4-dicarboxylate ABC transporter substrate-binding protein [Alcanivorax sp. N3-2A]
MRQRSLRTLLVLFTLVFSLGAHAENLRISAGMGQQHFWVGHFMDPFMKSMQAQSDLTFTPFYSGSLVTPGRELGALKSGIVSVAAPLLAPYHEGQFPLSDVTQLPTLNTNSVKETRALMALMASDQTLVDGKTFYQYELGDKGLRGWAVGATAAYSLSTTGKVLDDPDDLKGLPMRAGSTLHTILLQELGATPVTMTSADSYEALSRKTVEGTILSVADWPSYSFQELLKYTITGLSMGHWESYLAVTEKTWNGFTDEQRRTWNEVAKKTAMDNAAYIDQLEIQVRKGTAAKGATFVDLADLPEPMRARLGEAASRTWVRWIEQMEKAGHPGRAAATQWARLIREQGGEIPDGAARYLKLD